MTLKPFRADGGDIGTGRIREIIENPYGDEEKCWLAKRVLALQSELTSTNEKYDQALKDLDALWKSIGELEAEKKRNADYQELISGLVGVSSSILREVDRINNAAGIGKGDHS